MEDAGVGLARVYPKGYGVPTNPCSQSLSEHGPFIKARSVAYIHRNSSPSTEILIEHYLVIIMSFKSKNLQYERSEPAFLRRMRGELGGSTDDSDRQTNSAPLPKKPKRLEMGDDEGPTYVLEESGETVTKEEFEKIIAKNKDGEKSPVANAAGNQQGNGDQNEKNDNINQSKQQVAQIGALSKKRKIAKIVGEGPDADETDENPKPKVSSKSNVKKSKKKAKQIKLTFDDGNEEDG